MTTGNIVVIALLQITCQLPILPLGRKYAGMASVGTDVSPNLGALSFSLTV